MQLCACRHVALKANRTEMIDQLGGLQTQLNEFMTKFQDHLADFQTLSTQVQTIQAGGVGGGGGGAGDEAPPHGGRGRGAVVRGRDA